MQRRFIRQAQVQNRSIHVHTHQSDLNTRNALPLLRVDELKLVSRIELAASRNDMQHMMALIHRVVICVFGDEIVCGFAL